MKTGEANQQAGTTAVVVVTADAAFEALARTTFGASERIALDVLPGTLASVEGDLDGLNATVAVVDLDRASSEDMQALERLTTRAGSRLLPIVAVTAGIDADLARTLVLLRVADFLVKPVQPAELVRTCARVVKTPAKEAQVEAQIYTFLSAVGGAGVSTLAIQSAMILLNSGARARSSTCLVDLDFQHGACADYLDIEPRLNLSEIEPRPERLDRQLLEIMLSHHSSESKCA